MKTQFLHIGCMVVGGFFLGCGTSEMTDSPNVPIPSREHVVGNANWVDADLGQQSFQGSLILTNEGVFFGDVLDKYSVLEAGQNAHGLLEKKAPPKTYDGKLYMCGSARKPFPCGCGDGTGAACTYTW